MKKKQIYNLIIGLLIAVTAVGVFAPVNLTTRRVNEAEAEDVLSGEFNGGTEDSELAEARKRVVELAKALEGAKGELKDANTELALSLAKQAVKNLETNLKDAEKKVRILENPNSEEAKTEAKTEEDKKAKAVAELKRKEEIEACGGVWSGFNWLCIFDKIIVFIGNLILSIFSWILWFAGLLLNFTLTWTLTNLKGTLDGFTIIEEGWKNFRDIGNIMFIFVLLYISIGTILRLSGVDMKKMLMNVILFAVLINFSLFFTRVIIDVSNVFAINFYNSAVSDKCAKLNDYDGGITCTVMNNLRLTGLYNPNSIDSAKTMEITKSSPGLFFISAVYGSVFMFIAAFIFFVAAFLFITRFVVIVFLMILSPIAFAGWILPKTATYSEKWFNALLDQAYWPVVFMALLSFSLKATEYAGNIGGQGGGGLMDAFLGNASGSFIIVFQYFVIIAFLIATIYVAKQAGAKGADFSTKAAGALTTGLAAKIGRNTVGRLGNRLVQSEKMQELAKEGGAKGFGARMALSTADWTRKRSFDVGAAPGIATIAKETGVSMGKPKVGGFMAEREEKAKAIVKATERYGATDEEKKDLNSLKYKADQIKKSADSAREKYEKLEQKDKENKSLVDQENEKLLKSKKDEVAKLEEEMKILKTKNRFNQSDSQIKEVQEKLDKSKLELDSVKLKVHIPSSELAQAQNEKDSLEKTEKIAKEEFKKLETNLKNRVEANISRLEKKWYSSASIEAVKIIRKGKKDGEALLNEALKEFKKSNDKNKEVEEEKNSDEGKK